MNLLYYFFDLTLFQRLGQNSLKKIRCYFGRKRCVHKIVSVFTDLYSTPFFSRLVNTWVRSCPPHRLVLTKIFDILVPLLKKTLARRDKVLEYLRLKVITVKLGVTQKIRKDSQFDFFLMKVINLLTKFEVNFSIKSKISCKIYEHV